MPKGTQGTFRNSEELGKIKRWIKWEEFTGKLEEPKGTWRSSEELDAAQRNFLNSKEFQVASRNSLEFKRKNEELYDWIEKI